jgi:HSP20 family molecular chaperone IbpA
MNAEVFQYLSKAIGLAAIMTLTTACGKTETSSNLNTPTPSPTATPTASLSPTTTLSPAISPTPSGSPFADIHLRMRDLQSQLDNIFAETFRDFGTSFGQTGFASSVDLRDLKDKYVVRIYLPSGDTSKVDAKIDNGNLDITMNGVETNKAGSQNYQEVISLPEPVQSNQMQIQRKPNMVVITVPKSGSNALAAASPAAAPSTGATASPFHLAEDWDQRMIDDMRQMENRMDQVLRNTFPNDFRNAANTLTLGSTVNVEDQKDKYVVHFTLPDHNISNVKLDFTNGELRLSAEEQKKASNTTANGNVEKLERGRYQEMITLPGPVKEDQMQVARKMDAVVVTLPKA